MNWQELFRELEIKGDIPDAARHSIDGARAEFRSMYLDLGEVQQKINESGLHPPLVTLYADVLNLPNNLGWLLQNSVLMIVARRVEVGSSVIFSLDYRTTHTASLLLYTNELAGTLVAVAATDSKPWRFILSAAPERGGWQILFQDGAPAETQPTRAQGMAMLPTQTFQVALLTEFIFASLLYDQRPALALSMLTWLKDWSAESNDLLGIFLRSSSLVSLLSSQINARVNGAAFVPYLTQQVYTQLATAFATEARQYESDYQALSTQKVLTSQGIELAQALLDNQIYQSEYATKLLDMAKTNYDNAESAVDAARKSFEKAKLNAELLQIDFQQIGIPEWVDAKILGLIIDLVSATMDFAVGVSGLLTGNEAAGAAATAKAVTEAVKVEGLAKQGSEAAVMARNLAAVMKELKKVGEGLAKTYAFSSKVVAAARNIDNAASQVKKMQAMDIETGGADLSGTATWEIYRLAASATLQGPVDKGVEFAKNLQLAVQEVAIYGQALAGAQLAAIKAGQDFAAVLLQKELAQRQQKRLQLYVDSLKVGEAPIVAMMQEFYQRYLDAKSSLFAALECYRASYFYWALQESAIQPKIIDRVNQIDTGLKDLTAIALDWENALNRFSPPPQVMARKLFVVEAPAVIESLREDKTGAWSLSLGAAAFEGIDRVRLTTVRIWLEGAVPGPSDSIHVMITTSGSYLDRLETRPYQFTAKPLQRIFEYKVSNKPGGDWEFDNGTYGYVEIDGTVDHEVSYAYFEPTPFAEWQIDLRKFNPGIDLSGVTKITMEFAGSVVPDVVTERTSRASTAPDLPAARRLRSSADRRSSPR